MDDWRTGKLGVQRLRDRCQRALSAGLLRLTGCLQQPQNRWVRLRMVECRRQALPAECAAVMTAQ